jgi:hypothetical protein
LVWTEEIGSKLTEDIGYTLTGEYALDKWVPNGSDARLVGIGQDGALVHDVRFKNLVKPVPVHRCLKHRTASRMPLEQMLKSNRNFVIDTPSFPNGVPVIDDAEDAVVLMEVDTDINPARWVDV